jgi:hypothetical protein
VRKFVFLLFCGLVVISSAFASTLRPTSDREKFSNAPFVAAVEILSISTKETENKSIISIATANVLRNMKGNLPDKIQIILPGGQRSTIHEDGSTSTSGTLIPGAPRLSKGKFIVTLASAENEDSYYLYSWDVPRLQKGRDGKLMVHQGEPAGNYLKKGRASKKQEMTLDEFEGKVHEATR